jgi:hypothetical protein
MLSESTNLDCILPMFSLHTLGLDLKVNVHCGPMMA